MNVNLQHPVPVTIERLKRGIAPQDDDFREPIQGAEFEAPIVCQGQVRWGSDASQDVTRIGNTEDGEGYVVFRTVDLRSIDITVGRGDRLSQFGYGANAVSKTVFVTRTAPFAHYPDQGGAACVKCYFSTRRPARLE